MEVIAEHCENIIVILNVGGQVDLKDILSVHQVKALLNLVQPGMEEEMPLPVFWQEMWRPVENSQIPGQRITVISPMQKPSVM